jgi:hypothetical protein
MLETLRRRMDDEVIQASPGLRQVTAIARASLCLQLARGLATLRDSPIPHNPYVGIAREDAAQLFKRGERVSTDHD